MNYGIKKILHNSFALNKSHSRGSGQPRVNLMVKVFVAIMSIMYGITTWQWGCFSDL